MQNGEFGESWEGHSHASLTAFACFGLSLQNTPRLRSSSANIINKGIFYSSRKTIHACGDNWTRVSAMPEKLPADTDSGDERSSTGGEK
jgi:hypothetical protein